ncbi:MAG: hypothetical protein M3340_04945 [Actinomycetota bacterium]|nr:hypothetical protein [Actinomycetota bacterium]
MPRVVPLLTLIAALAAAGCDDGGPDPVALSETEACKAVEERLKLDQFDERFGKPDRTQDFFGDSVVTYERGDVTWQFQVSAQTGTFRALLVEGAREKAIDCPN